MKQNHRAALIAAMTIAARSVGQSTPPDVPGVVTVEPPSSAPSGLTRKGARQVLAERRREVAGDLIRTGLNRQSRRILSRRTRLAPA